MENITQKKFVSRVLSYSAMAAAGLLVEPATAGVVVSGPSFVPVTVAAGETKGIDFGAPYGSVFQFAGNLSFGSLSVDIQPGAAGLGPLGVVLPGGGNDPARLASGYFVGASRAWLSYVGAFTTEDIAGNIGFWNGAAGVPVRGFLGVRFFTGTDYNYGYFDLTYDNTPDSQHGTLTINGWAYESTAGVGLTTTAAASTATPEPGTMAAMGLGLLALGASGIRRKRAGNKAA